MKKLAIVIGTFALIGTPALAADIATKAPAPSPAPVYNWTGWYVGGNVGVSFGRANTDYNVAPFLLLGGTPPSIPILPAIPLAIIGSSPPCGS